MADARTVAATATRARREGGRHQGAHPPRMPRWHRATWEARAEVGAQSQHDRTTTGAQRWAQGWRTDGRGGSRQGPLCREHGREVANVSAARMLHAASTRDAEE